jgi:hypothetical protein
MLHFPLSDLDAMDMEEIAKWRAIGIRIMQSMAPGGRG